MDNQRILTVFNSELDNLEREGRRLEMSTGTWDDIQRRYVPAPDGLEPDDSDGKRYSNGNPMGYPD